jgi:hypothetical protein
VPVHSRIPTSFSVDLVYEAVAGKGGRPMVKGDSKGTRQALSRADFKTPPGAPAASYGTITVSNAKPDTRLILEGKAAGRDRSKPAGKPEEEVSGKTGAGAEAGTAQRFKSAFTITQA